MVLLRGHVVKCGMQSFPVVINLDILEYGGPEFLFGFPFDTFG